MVLAIPTGCKVSPLVGFPAAVEKPWVLVAPHHVTCECGRCHCPTPDTLEMLDGKILNVASESHACLSEVAARCHL